LAFPKDMSADEISVTVTSTGATFGNCEMGSVRIESPPKNRMMREITMASAGLFRILVNMVCSFILP